MASLAHFALMASTASAALLTLSSFQGLTISVPVQCLYAYNMPIQRCTPDDFSVGASCSQSCIAGLQAAQFTVRGLCPGVNAPANSLLKQIQDGHIVDVLCGANKAPAPTATASVTPPKQTTPKQTPSPSSEAPRPVFSTLSTSTTPAQATSSSALPEATTSTTTTAASSTSAESEADSTSEAAPSATTTTITEDDSSPTSQPSDNDQTTSSTRTTKPKPTRPPNSQPGSGGGSPFDFVAVSRATKAGLAGGFFSVFMAVASSTMAFL
ncbi:hypothetical protein V8C44DRAFT_342215 [Trichoderma aethiopicum]